ncbi:MAG: hypothetical protein WC942_10560, partial [Clostridia bacterium]
NLVVYDSLGIYKEVVNNQAITFLVIPHLWKYTDESTLKEIQDKIKEFSQIKDDSKKIILGHFTLEGSQVSDSFTILKGQSDFILNLGIFENSGANYILLGHIHKPQVLTCGKSIAHYSGSIEHVTWGEIKNELGFWLVNNWGIPEFIPLKTRPKQILLPEELSSILTKNKEELKGKLIQVLINSTNSNIFAEIKKKVTDAGAIIEVAPLKMEKKKEIISKEELEKLVNDSGYTWKEYAQEKINSVSIEYDKQLLTSQFEELLSKGKE